MALVPFERTYNGTDFGLTADVTCQPSIWTDIGEVTVPAGQKIAFGIGNTKNGVDTREIVYIDVEDTGGSDLTGSLRLVVTNATETRSVVVLEDQAAKLKADQTDKSKGRLLALTPPFAREDSKLKIQYKPPSTSAETVDTNETTMTVPVTVLQ